MGVSRREAETVARAATSTRPAQPRVSVVVPALNEARNLRGVLPRLPAVHEVVLVDGGSVDGTVQAAREARPDVVVVTQRRRGKGNALAAGFAEVTGDVVVTLDADGSVDPGEIPRFVEALVGGADFARGTRSRPGGGGEDLTPVRRLGRRFLRTWVDVSSGARFADLRHGCHAFWADLVPLLDLPDHALAPPPGTPMLWGDGFEIETLLTFRFAAAGLTVAEVPSVVPSVERARTHGETHLRTVRDGVRVLHTLRTERARLARDRRRDRQLLG